MKDKIIFLALCTFLISNTSFSQVFIGDNSFPGENFDVGGAVKLSWEISGKSSFSLSLVGGIGTQGINDALYPSFHSELRFYKGGIGSSLNPKKFKNINIDFISSLQIMGGIKTASAKSLNSRYVPIIHFTEFSATPLLNPYNNSFSLGTTIILPLNDDDKKWQRLGVLNFNVERTVSFNYYNDGTPFQKFGFGDAEDRYYTGGGFFSYHNDYDKIINYGKISYHRYTGYSKNTFQFTGDLEIDFVAYPDVEQYYYNQSRFSFSLGNQKYATFIGLSYYNTNTKDGQSFIHYVLNDGYHPDLNKPLNKFALSLEYNAIFTNSL